MNRTLARAALLVAGLSLLLIGTPAQADNVSFYKPWVGHFPHATGNLIHWKSSTGYVTWDNGARAAAVSWSASSTHVELLEQPTMTNIEVHLGNFGVNQECGHTNSSATDGSGNWVTTVHWYFNADDMGGATNVQLKTCGVHEFGHALGLDHFDKTLCSDVQMMDPGNELWTCGYTDPRAGDRGGINSLYYL